MTDTAAISHSMQDMLFTDGVCTNSTKQKMRQDFPIHGNNTGAGNFRKEKRPCRLKFTHLKPGRAGMN